MMIDSLHPSSPPLDDTIGVPAPSYKSINNIQHASGSPPSWPNALQRSKTTPIFSVLPRNLNLPTRSSYHHPVPPHSSPVSSTTSASENHPSSGLSPPHADHPDSFHSPSSGSCYEKPSPTRRLQTPPHACSSDSINSACPPSPSIPSSTDRNLALTHPHTPPSTASPASSFCPAPSAEPFFDADVVFPLPLPHVDPHQINCHLEHQLGWEEWARSRVATMMSKEASARRGPFFDVKCGLPETIRLEAVRWLLQFDLNIEDYPSLLPHTRYRAIVLYSKFWSLRALPQGVSKEDETHAARVSAVVALVLATKVDVDVFCPLFDISLQMWSNQVFDWIGVHPADLGAFERAMLQELDYKTTASTPFDYVTELVIACPELEAVMRGCGKDWERVEEVFSTILENAVQNHAFVQFRTPVLAAAALFLALEKGPFRHPGKLGGLNSWARRLDGSWMEVPTTGRSASVSVAFEGSGMIVDAHLKSSISGTMNLPEAEVRRCKRWCRSLGK